MNAYAQHNVGFYSRRTMSFFLVAGVHVAVFAALMLTISTTKVPALTDPFVAKIIDRHRPTEALPKAPPLKNEFNLYVPPDEFKVPPIDDNIDTRIVGEPRVIPAVESRPPQPPLHVARLEQGGAGAGFPDPASFYPSPSIRFGEVGVSVVRVCVNAKGRLTAAPETLNTSGFQRLDRAAIDLAKAGSGHYRPSTQDGVPVDACYPVGVRFQLKN